MARQSTKSLYVLRKVAETGGTIIVASEVRRRRILHQAKVMGIENVNVVTLLEGQPMRGVTLAGVIVDNPPSERPWIDKRTDATRTHENKDKSYTFWERCCQVMRKMEEERLKETIGSNMYRFYVSAVPNFISDAEIITHYMGCGVVVVDRNGREWLNGKPYDE